METAVQYLLRNNRVGVRTWQINAAFITYFDCRNDKVNKSRRGRLKIGPSAHARCTMYMYADHIFALIIT